VSDSATNLRVVHGHWSRAQGGELILWGEDQRLWAGPRYGTRNAHPFAPTVAQLRAGLGKRLSALAVGSVTSRVQPPPGFATLLQRPHYGYVPPPTNAIRQAILSLPTTELTRPLPSPQLAQALDVTLPAAARLQNWNVQGLTLGPVSTVLFRQTLRESKLNIVAAPSLDFFADLAQIALALTRAGALLPSARGWELDADIAARLQEQLQPPAVVALQYPEIENLVTQILDGFARQFALSALSHSQQFANWRQFSNEEYDDWLQVLVGRRQLKASDERTPANIAHVREIYAREHANPTPPALTLANASAIDTWVRALAPARETVQALPRLSLTLQTPDAGEQWPLMISFPATIEEAEPPTAPTAPTLDPPTLMAVLDDIKRLCPALSALTDLPAALNITPAAVIEIVEAREVLAAHGYELEIPPALEEIAQPRARAVVGSANTSTGLLSADAICTYRFELGVGDEWLSASELATLVDAKAPLVRVRGRWRRLDKTAVRRAVELISKGEQQTNVLGALRLSQSLDVAPDSDEELTIDAPRLSESLLTLLDGSLNGNILAPTTPAGFRGQMRDYQRFGLGWISFLEERGFGACLADDMGLGKTVQCLAVLEAERARIPRAQRAPTLLVVPFSAVSNWEEEAERFCPQLRFHIHHGSDRYVGAELAKVVADADVCMTSYKLLVRDLAALQAITWGRLALDEVQTIKNATTKVARAAFSLPARRRLALSGTPVENRLSELWSVMHLLNPGLLGTRAAFGREFSLPIERDSDEEVAARLRALTAPFILRRTKRDPEIRKQLPAKIERTRPCPLSADQAALYQATVENMLKQIETADPLARRGLILKVITQLKQICNHPLNFAEDGGAIAGRSGKLAELERITADALACNEKTLCFTQYPSFAHRLAPYLRTRLGCGVEVFDGKLNDRARRALRHRFTDDVDLGLLLVSYGAGGTAVNLVAANHVVLYDRWWNPAVEDQAADRSYRIGQDKDVYVHRLLSAGTLEERIEALLERKRALADLVISSLAAEITALDNTALREMLSLSTRALSESWGDE
jgi:superfamily II DNA or RNA helicase